MAFDINKLIDGVSLDNLKKFCRDKSGNFLPSTHSSITHSNADLFSIETYKKYFQTLDIVGYFTDIQVFVFMVSLTPGFNLRERSCRRLQFDFAKDIMKKASYGGNQHSNLTGWLGDKAPLVVKQALFVFADEDGSFRFSLVENVDKNAEIAQRFKRYTFFVNDEQSNRTFREKMQGGEWDKYETLQKAFSVEKLSADFFNDYKEHYQDFVEYATGKRFVKSGSKWIEKTTHIPNADIMGQFAVCTDPEKALRDYVKKMMGRLVFLQFLTKKGWLGVPEGAEWGTGDKEYLKNLFENSADKDNFLEAVLEKLFFDTLNQDRGSDAIADPVLAVNGGKVRIPYLNGGLFEKDKLDAATVKFPETCFRDLFDTFERYNFTIDENDPDDKEVGVDPEMLGRIFENLLEDNKDKGAFYTPKEIVQYMCEESLIAYIGDNEANRKLVKEFDAADITDSAALLAKLKDVKICDPAIGSGAFPMGMLNILYRIRLILEDKDFSPGNIVTVKKEIIQNNIYGVDIESGAVDIARLRFWLSIVVDENEPIPLPNLDYKIMQGNSLLEQYNGVDLSQICNFMPSEDTVKKSKRGKKQKDSDEATLLDLFDDTLCTPKIMNDAMDYYFSIKQHDLKEQYKERINGKVLNCIKSALKQDDVAVDWENKPFFLWHTYFWDVFNKKGGFDIVIGNPPYLKEGRISKNLFAQYKDNPYYEGKMDLWQIFACQGMDLLSRDGHLCFIAANTWISNKGAEKLRNKIVDDAKIEKMIDFGEYMIFKDGDKKKDGPSIQTMIMLFAKDDTTDNYSFDWRYLREKSSKSDMLALLKQEDVPKAFYKNPTVKRENLKGWFFTFSGDESVLKKIYSGKKQFLKAKEATNGIHSHFDFVNNKISGAHPWTEVGQGIFGLSEKELQNLQLDKKEKELIKPYYTPEEVTRFFTSQTNKLWLIYTDSSFKNKKKMNDYPVLKAHLDKFNKIITSDNKPYGLHRAREERFFNGEKILSLRMCSGRPLFSYSDFPCYVSASFYVIQTTRWNMKFLTGLLNSKLIQYWLRHMGKMKGNIYQIDKAPLQSVPIVEVTENEQAEVDKVIAYVDEILQKKSQNINADTSSIEQAIDNIIYKLYGFTDREIAIIDEGLNVFVAGNDTYNASENIVPDDIDDGDI